MAIEKIHESFLYAAMAAADLSGNLHYFATVNSDAKIALAGDGAAVLGVIYEAAIADKPVTVQFGCIGKVIAGGAITAGALIASDADGKAVAAAVGDFTVGMALTAADAGDVFSFAFLPGRRHA